MHFNEEHFEKRFLFKRKEINYKQQYTRIKHRQPKGKQNHKINFFTTKLTKVVRVGPTVMSFHWSSKKGFDKKSLGKQTNDFQIKQTNKIRIKN